MLLKGPLSAACMGPALVSTQQAKVIHIDRGSVATTVYLAASLTFNQSQSCFCMIHFTLFFKATNYEHSCVLNQVPNHMRVNLGSHFHVF
jgi:hypothetical protein